MNLFDALTAVAAQTGLNAEKLMEYADEWQGDNERAFLYAIVRALHPKFALELGTHTGEGANVIVKAMLDGLGTSNLITVDILDEPHIGSAIPTNLRPYVTLVTANIDEWVADKSGFDFIFDDGSHSIHQVHQIYGHLDQLLNPDGIIISHDAAAGGVGDYIREGQTKSGYDLPVYIIDPLPFGYSVYRKPGWEKLPESEAVPIIVRSEPFKKATEEWVSEFTDPTGKDSVKALLPDTLDDEIHAPVDIEELPEPEKVVKKQRRSRSKTKK